MFKKGNNIFSLLIIILSVFMTSSSNIVQADGSPATGQDITSTDTGTGSTGENTDVDKTPVTAFGDSLITSTQLINEDGTTGYNTNKSMRAQWTFSTELNGDKQVIHDGDTMTVKVPDQLAISTDVTGTVSQSGDDSKEAIGDLHLDKASRTIKVIFNQNAANLSKSAVITGDFWIKSLSWDVNTDFSKPIVLNWTTKGTASQPEPGLNTTVNVTKPSLPDNKEILFKYGGFVGTTIEWTVRINYRKDDIKDAIYKDTIGPNQRLLHDADHPIVAYPVTFDQTTGEMTEDTSNGSIIKDLKTNDTGTPGFTASLGEINQTIILKYTTQATTTQGTTTQDVTDSSQMSAAYGNTGDLLSNTTELQNITANLTTNKLGGEGVANTSITSMVGTKLWDLPEGTTHPDKVTIDLLKNGIFCRSQSVTQKDNNWTYGFYNLPQYDNNGDINKYSVQEEPVPGFKSTVVIPDSTHSTTLQNIVNTIAMDKSKFKVTKVWHDGSNADGLRPGSISIGIFDGGNNRPENYPDYIYLNDGNNWTYTYTNLPAPKVGDVWYVSEGNTPNYIRTDSYNNDNQNDKIVTNTLATNLTVTKKWDDGDNKNVTNHDPVDVQLFANDNKQGNKPLGDPVTLEKKNNWKYEFGANVDANKDSPTNRLPKYDSSDKEITYEAKEVKVPTGYQSEDTFDKNDKTKETITNTSTDDTRDFTVNKIWSDNDSPKRPSSITVYLTANDKKTGDPVTIKPDTNGKWSYTWTGLAKNDADGKAIQYSVDENDVDGYAKNVDVDQGDTSATITNTANTTPTDNQTNFQVSKVWDDDNSASRPSSVQVQLEADGEPLGSPVTLSKDNNWTYNWDKLDKTANDKDIKYTVSEVNAPAGYTPTTSYPNSTTATITNTLDKTPGGNTGDTTTNIKVTKIWSDNNNQDKLRPSSVTVNLLKDDDTKVDSVVLNSDNNWTHEFTGLDKSTKYHVTEDNVDNYTTNIDQTDLANVQITNTHTPSTTTTDDKTNLNVTKTWSDSNNKDNLRPSKVTIHLLKDGKEVDSAVLNADNNWAHNFTGLDKTSTYTVSENAVSGYTSNIDKTSATDVKITNTHTPSTTTTTKDDKTNLTVNKLWNDSNNKDNLRPSQVTVHLLKNGSVIGQAVQLSSLNAWSYTWNNLDKNGNYSVQEDAVSGYTAAQSSNNNVITITNTHTPITPGNPDTPGNPFTPDNPGGNNGNNGGNGGTGDQVNTGNGGGGSNTTTDFTPGNPMVPSVPYQKTNTSNGLLPQTGSKDANILYSILGVLILGFISIFELKRKRA